MKNAQHMGTIAILLGLLAYAAIIACGTAMAVAVITQDWAPPLAANPWWGVVIIGTSILPALTFLHAAIPWSLDVLKRSTT